MLLAKAPRSSNPPLLYAGVFLDPLSTARLLSFASPKHSKLSADHLTMIYRPSQDILSSLTLGLVVDLQVLGKVEDSALQAVAVQCPGWVMKFLQRPAHVTVSMAEGSKRKTAGDLLQKVQQGHIYGVEYTRCTEDITLTGRSKVFGHQTEMSSTALPNQHTVFGLQAKTSSPHALEESDVAPPRSSSPVDDLVLELQVQHLMDKVPGLAPAMAGFAIEACQGNIEQATSLLQQHMPSLTQTAPESSSSPDAARLPSAVVQPPLTVDLERNGQVGQGAALPENSSHSGRKQVLLPAGATSHRVSHQATHVPVSRSSSNSPPSVQHHRVPGQSAHTYSTCSSDAEAGFYDASQPAGGFSTAHLLHDGVLLTNDPVAAAFDEARKVVEERNRIKSLADQERQTLGLHSQARDTYFTAAQVAFEKGDREAAHELTGRGKEHAHLAKEARQRANQAAYDSCNMSVTNRFKVDLHGLHVEEALQVLQQHLLSLGGLGCPGGVLLQVITGIGKHSTNGRPKILPAVIRYLSDAGHRFSEAVGNSGIIDVFIGGQRRLL
ncbi:hypothetical protein WJX82_010916 [Trebouxia sp. C0006]